MSSIENSQKDLPENQGMSQEAFKQLIQAAMSFKERSHHTLHEVHIPELTSSSSSQEREPQSTVASAIDVVLIGDSMLERFKTTGTSTRLAQVPRSINLGCGGDKVENVLYRLSFMTPLLENRSIKLWIVMVGTNNLRKKGLRPSDIPLYRLLLQALLRIDSKSKIIACEIFKRKDFEDKYVDEANNMIKTMITEMNSSLGLQEDRIIWSEAPAEAIIEHLDDHVHLNEEGYRIWDETLYPRAQQLIV
ncbi:hypothetical protein BGZ80_006405 [Entomortierella chlamydospora]|uniref:SGNH hydrolase-type esterase domain-containing protein n=1 Tax=Entomortierella chlamydospora TaxID=101097 RepID=A0A9P6N076_9FUNG|nr:hypothetical protein BGZ79_005472 [Entomortierella chlamydospora]KAG0019036.1 hypothetical protein BGZ80_006405 [Entomortierella chlamydospora]